MCWRWWPDNKYQAVYGKEPGVSADTAYDSVYIIANTINKLGTLDTEKVADAILARSKFSGASGLVEFDQDGGAHKQFYFKQVNKEGKLVDYKGE